MNREKLLKRHMRLYRQIIKQQRRLINHYASLAGARFPLQITVNTGFGEVRSVEVKDADGKPVWADVAIKENS